MEIVNDGIDLEKCNDLNRTSRFKCWRQGKTQFREEYMLQAGYKRNLM